MRAQEEYLSTQNTLSILINESHTRYFIGVARFFCCIGKVIRRGNVCYPRRKANKKIKGDYSFPALGLSHIYIADQNSQRVYKQYVILKTRKEDSRHILKQQIHNIDESILARSQAIGAMMRSYHHQRLHEIRLTIGKILCATTESSLSHACYSFMSSGYDKALAISIDAAGEDTSLAVYRCEKGEITRHL